jgi:hypothetical protein
VSPVLVSFAWAQLAVADMSEEKEEKVFRVKAECFYMVDGRRRCKFCTTSYGKDTGATSLKYHMWADHKRQAQLLGMPVAKDAAAAASFSSFLPSHIVLEERQHRSRHHLLSPLLRSLLPVLLR